MCLAPYFLPNQFCYLCVLTIPLFPSSSLFRPTPFICLILKMLQIQPEKDIVVEFIKNEDFKYVRALGAYYMRLTGSALDCYKYLEPLYNDYRKIRRVNRDGKSFIVSL